MSSDDLVRSWKDPLHRYAHGRPAPHPAGDLDAEVTRLVEAGTTGRALDGTQHLATAGCCVGYTSEARCVLSALYMPYCSP